MLEDTIVAQATFPAESALGIIRISGGSTFPILKKCFKFKSNKKTFENIKSHTIHNGFIFNNQNEIIDNVLISIFKSPGSYTGEDMAEITCHGNPFIIYKIINLLISNGCRIAEPGEFTKRAFLNGKMDLSEAEAVADLISAKNDIALKLSLKQLLGDEKNIINDLRKKIIDVLSLIDGNLDFSEDIYAIDTDNLKTQILQIISKLKKLVNNADEGLLLKEGIKLVITGKPNVGKSSLLNLLLKKDKSIVTHIPGTTRDIIEDKIIIEGLPFLIFDTAGIRKAKGIVEKIGIKKTKNVIKNANLVLFLLDGSKKITKDDIKIFKEIKNKNFIIVINKIDLKQKISKKDIIKNFKCDEKSTVEISALKNKGINDLTKLIKNTIINTYNLSSVDEIYISNLRHKIALENAIKFLNNAIENLKTLEIAAVDIKKAIGSIETIIGKIADEDILNNIFQNFCIGK
jgi:tRNA modification GTPase